MKYRWACVMTVTAACGGGGGPTAPLGDSRPPDFVEAAAFSVPEIHLAAGDVDNDGDVDLYMISDNGGLVTGMSAVVRLARNDGAGTLRIEDPTVVYEDCTRPRLEKIDPDDFVDVVCLPTVFGGASAQLSQGGASFVSAGHDGMRPFAARAWPVIPSAIVVATKTDLRALAIAPNDAQMASTTLASADFGTLAVADLDGDGKPELIAGKGPAWSVFSGVDQARQDYAGAVGDLETADLNRDGHPDLLAINGSLVAISLVNAGAPAAPVVIDGPQVEADHFIVDYDGDGVPDVMFVGVGPQVFVMRGTGTGTLSPPEALLVDGSVPTYMPGHNLSAVADFDRDGKIDLALSDVQTHVVRIYKGR